MRYVSQWFILIDWARIMQPHSSVLVPYVYPGIFLPSTVLLTFNAAVWRISIKCIKKRITSKKHHHQINDLCNNIRCSTWGDEKCFSNQDAHLQEARIQKKFSIIGTYCLKGDGCWRTFLSKLKERHKPIENEHFKGLRMKVTCRERKYNDGTVKRNSKRPARRSSNNNHGAEE